MNTEEVFVSYYQNTPCFGTTGHHQVLLISKMIAQASVCIVGLPTLPISSNPTLSKQKGRSKLQQVKDM
jgi:hypothetical protein